MQPGSFQLRDYGVLVKRHWIALLCALALGILGSIGWLQLQRPVFTAESSGYVAVGSGEDLASLQSAESIARSKAAGYEVVAATRPVAEQVIDALALETTPDKLVSRISVEAVEDTPVLRVTAEAGTPSQARQLADAWVLALAEQARKIEGQGSSEGKESLVRIDLLSEASTPTAPVFPNVNLIVAIGGLTGLLAWLCYVLIQVHFDRRIRSAGTIEENFSIPVLATIPVDRTLDLGGKLIAQLGRASTDRRNGHAVGEALRELRTNLSFVDVDKPPRIMVITSSLPDEGKTTVTANLASIIAASGQQVTVVDGDLRRPSLTEAFGLVPGAGVTDVLTGRAQLDDVLQPWGPQPNLMVLGAGRVPPNPSELVGSAAMTHMLRELATKSIVLIDTSPMLPVTDAAILASIADGALVVVSAGRSRIEELERTRQSLSLVGARVLGVILNRVPNHGFEAKRYGYYGQNYYVDDPIPSADISGAVSESAEGKHLGFQTVPLSPRVPENAAKE
ncbi:MAG: polysaccharide biosynthesis tyrosine autokinase [Actinomycetota bacterium]